MTLDLVDRSRETRNHKDRRYLIVTILPSPHVTVIAVTTFVLQMECSNNPLKILDTTLLPTLQICYVKGQVE